MIPLPFQAYVYGYLWWSAVLGMTEYRNEEVK